MLADLTPSRVATPISCCSLGMAGCMAFALGLKTFGSYTSLVCVSMSSMALVTAAQKLQEVQEKAQMVGHENYNRVKLSGDCLMFCWISHPVLVTFAHVG